MPSTVLPIIHALVPVKALDRAKSRLSPLLTPGERQQLVLAMLRDVLLALSATPQIGGISIISTDHMVQRVARELGAATIDDGADLNLALQRGATVVRSTGAQPLLMFADLPLVTAAEIGMFVQRIEQADVVFAASRDGGTNALLGGAGMPLSFGSGSLAQHQRTAHVQHLRSVVIRLPGLERDIDQPGDIAWLVQQPGHTASEQFVRGLGLTKRVGLACVPCT